jgi:hypothetical protein
MILVMQIVDHRKEQHNQFFIIVDDLRLISKLHVDRIILLQPRANLADSPLPIDLIMALRVDSCDIGKEIPMLIVEADKL